MSEEFYRMKRLPPYVIAEVNAMRAAARAAGEDIIDLGMGNPDLPPPPHVIDKLIEVVRKPDAHGYSQSKGIPGLRKAQANYYGRRFGVDVDPETEVVVTMGSKEGLASLATAITAPGDVVLAPNPSYPIHMFGFILAGATIRSVPTTPDENYFRSLDRAMAFTRCPAHQGGAAPASLLRIEPGPRIAYGRPAISAPRQLRPAATPARKPGLILDLDPKV